jgi:uncharacterized protein
MNQIYGPTILLSDGTYFNFDTPTFGPQVVEVIAHSLSNLCRFTGHCRAFYSVAEHSVHLSHIVPREYALAGLLHDAAEAFVGDIAKPLKVMLPEYAVIEDRVEQALFAHLGLPLQMPPAIKTADRAMLRVEQQQAMLNNDGWHFTHGEEPAPVTLQFWSPAEAKRQFMRRFQMLADGVGAAIIGAVGE